MIRRVIRAWLILDLAIIVALLVGAARRVAAEQARRDAVRAVCRDIGCRDLHG